jgi:sporulation protein YlmC with PRC-barrel domain
MANRWRRILTTMLLAPALALAAAADIPASKLIGKAVANKDGQNLGEIRELVLDLHNGVVRYAVLEFSGVLGAEEKYFAYPASAFSHSARDGEVVLDVDRRQLELAEGFERSRWPQWNDPHWSRAERRAGTEGVPPVIAPSEPEGEAMGPGAEGKADALPGAGFVRASELIGSKVRDRAGEELGEVRDLTVNLGDGSIRDVLIDAAGEQRRIAPTELIFPAQAGQTLVRDARPTRQPA